MADDYKEPLQGYNAEHLVELMRGSESATLNTVKVLVARIVELESALQWVAAQGETVTRMMQNRIAEMNGDLEAVRKLGPPGGVWLQTPQGVAMSGPSMFMRARDVYGRKRAAAEFDDRIAAHEAEARGG